MNLGENKELLRVAWHSLKGSKKKKKKTVVVEMGGNIPHPYRGRGGKNKEPTLAAANRVLRSFHTIITPEGKAESISFRVMCQIGF